MSSFIASRSFFLSKRVVPLFALSAFFAVLGISSPTHAAASDPVAIIKKKDGELQKMLRDKESVKKTDKIKVLINGIFDFEEMGKRALGPDVWKTMTSNQQSRFVKAFKGMIENASVKKLEAYKNDSTKYDPAEITDNKANVTSHVFAEGKESIVTYKLLSTDTAWKAWDLIIDDLSTARNYGEQFKKILQTSDMNALIAKLEKKAAGDGKSGEGSASIETPSASAKTGTKMVAKTGAKSSSKSTNKSSAEKSKSVDSTAKP